MFSILTSNTMQNYISKDVSSVLQPISKSLLLLGLFFLFLDRVSFIHRSIYWSQHGFRIADEINGMVFHTISKPTTNASSSPCLQVFLSLGFRFYLKCIEFKSEREKNFTYELSYNGFAGTDWQQRLWML